MDEATTQINEADASITEKPQAQHKHLSQSLRKPSVSIIVNSDYNPVNGFIDFIREHAIVGLAIGFVIGTQVQSLVKQLVASFINPLFQLFLGASLTSRHFTISYNGRSAPFPWGAFVYALLDFLFVVATIYIIVKMLKLDKLDKPVVASDENKKEIDKILDDDV